MERYDSKDQVAEDFGPSAITIGKFDGVHAGHRAVIRQLREIADERDLTASVVTFDRNPLSLLSPEICPEALVSVDQKLDLLEQAGIDATLILNFDHALSEISPEAFVRTIVVETLHAKVVLVGADFRFGRHGAGTVKLLEELGNAAGFEVRVIQDVAPEGVRRVSSTWIRELLAAGEVARAAELLGSVPRVRARVVHGAHRGRALGYPTANLSPDIEGFIPADGVYAATLVVDSARYPAAVSVGNNPTFDGVAEKQVEAHALDQQIDLYDRVVEVEFVAYIRGMVKFDTPEELATQMRADDRAVRSILGIDSRAG